MTKNMVKSEKLGGSDVAQAATAPNHQVYTQTRILERRRFAELAQGLDEAEGRGARNRIGSVNEPDYSRFKCAV